MKTLYAILAAGMITAVASAQELTWSELARRPEFWPAQCALKRPMKFANISVAPGQKLTVVSIKGNMVELETPDGSGVFDAKAEDTDALAVALAAWKKLTPAQRALTYASLLQRKELWPYRVKLTQPANLNTGQLRAGEAVVLLGVEGNQLLVAAEKMTTMFTVEPRDTDLLQAARTLVENKEAFPGRVTEDLAGKLINPATAAPAPLEAKAQPRYYAFYRGAAWCGPCRQFSPALIKFYNESKTKYPDLEIVYISGDKSPAEMRGYAKEAGFSWRAVAANRQSEMQIVNRLFNQYIPQLVVTDRHGNVLINSAQTGGPDNALKQLDALLKTSSTKMAQSAP